MSSEREAKGDKSSESKIKKELYRAEISQRAIRAGESKEKQVEVR